MSAKLRFSYLYLFLELALLIAIQDYCLLQSLVLLGIT